MNHTHPNENKHTHTHTYIYIYIYTHIKIISKKKIISSIFQTTHTEKKRKISRHIHREKK